MTSPRLRTASFAGDSIRAQRTLFLFGSRAPRRRRSAASRLTRRRDGACGQPRRSRGADLRRRFCEELEGIEGVEGIEGIEGGNRGVSTVDPLDPLDPLGPRHRPRRIPGPAHAHRPHPGEPHHRRPRLPRPVRFPRRISARQRGRTGDVTCPRSLRDVFGHTASISRRRTS